LQIGCGAPPDLQPGRNDSGSFRQAPKITRVPVDGITSFLGISRWRAMIVFMPVQCSGMM